MVLQRMAANVFPPGPRSGLFGGGLYLKSLREPLAFTEGVARAYGDIACFRIARRRVYLLSHPEYVRGVLLTHYSNFLKGRGIRRTNHVMGEGLVTSDGDLHRRQRRLAQPSFQRHRIAAYARTMVEHAEHLSDGWRDGETVELLRTLKQLTLSVVGEVLFGADSARTRDEVLDALLVIREHFKVFRVPLDSLGTLLSPARRRRFNGATAQLDRAIYHVIEARRREGGDRGDLLSMLLSAADEEAGGARMTDKQVRDEALALFIGGGESNAIGLMWTFYMLAQHPEVEARLHREVDEVLGERPATGDDFARLTYTRMVFEESLRLYPPVWRLVRTALRDYEVGGYTVPAGSLVVVSPYVMHRDARYYPDPLRFDPSRWEPEARAARPSHSFFPFGGGPRRCLGEGFALMEAVLVLATLARRWRMRLVPDHRLELYVHHLLEPKSGLPVTLERRG